MELERIQSKIHTIRGQRVMLDFDLAELYESDTKSLKRSVRRNLLRFPDDFMFELTAEEWQRLRYQFGTSKRGGIRYLPFAFTEQGVAMLSSVLNSEKAITMNIAIMRAFVELRRYALTYAEMATLLQTHDKRLNDIDEVLTFLAEENQKRAEEIATMKTDETATDYWQERPRIGFKK